MLKRFMNWLLNRVQSLVGMMSGRRSSSRSTESSTVFRDRVAQLSQQSRQVNPSDSNNIPVAERASLIPPAEPLLEPATHPNDAAENLAEPILSAKSFDDQSANDYGSSKHRHLDFAAAALSDAVSVKPTFPTEVSALIGSPSSPDAVNPNESISADFSVRMLKKVPDGQLPAIHDLLPAVEAFPVEPVSSLSNLSNDSSLASEQAVLFSFDITESEEPAAQRTASVERSFSTTEIQDADLSLVADSSSIEALSNPAVNDELPINHELIDQCLKRELLDNKSEISQDINSEVINEPPVPSAQILAQNEVISELPGATVLTSFISQPVQELSEPAANTEPLLYPRLLPAPEAEVPIESEASQTVSSAESVVADTSLSSADPSVKAMDEARPVKNGVVKLLFTLKEGNFHGYVAPDDGTKDILFHQKYINADVFAQLERGVKVAASVKYIEGKAYATHVELL